MTLPRSSLIDSTITPYYHCVSRCVRRAFLCGKDALTGFDFEHRRAWIETRLHELAEIFAIDLCAYSVMSSHYHALLHLNAAQQEDWSEAEVIRRWRRLYRVPDWFHVADDERRAETVALWRERLGSISWFMKCVNEPLARSANKEDGCRGRFWEGRFRSQALLDEEAVLKCMAYVDLNPVRAGIAKTPEDAGYTSLQARVQGRPRALASFSDERRSGFVMPVTRAEYLTLVDWTGRQLRPGKRGAISLDAPPIVERLCRSSRRSWLKEMNDLTRLYFRAIGNTISLCNYRDHLGLTKLKGLRA